MRAEQDEYPARDAFSAHYRVSEQVHEALEQAAKRRNISVGTLVTQVLSNYARNDLYLEEVGYVKMAKEEYRRLLEFVPDDKLEEYGGSSVVSGVEAAILARAGSLNLDSALHVIRSGSGAGWYKVHEAREGDKRVVSLIHDLGPRSSVITAGYIKALFRRIGINPSVRTTNSSVVFEF